jgi:hypothetical protein
MITDSDEEDFKLRFRRERKSVNDYPEAFVDAVRYSAAKSLLTTSSSCSSCSSYDGSKLGLSGKNTYHVQR